MEFFRELDCLPVGIDEGKTARAISQMLFELLPQRRLKRAVNVVIEELADITTPKHRIHFGLTILKFGKCAVI